MRSALPQGLEKGVIQIPKERRLEVTRDLILKVREARKMYEESPEYKYEQELRKYRIHPANAYLC
jgi:hypothetical protein